MMASAGFLTVLVSSALLLTVFTPIILIILFIRDWRNGSQW